MTEKGKKKEIANRVEADGNLSQLKKKLSHYFLTEFKLILTKVQLMHLDSSAHKGLEKRMAC